MKRTLFITSAVVILAGIVGLSGCCCHRPAACGGNCVVDGGCNTCDSSAGTCQPSDCGNCGDCGTCDQGYNCVQQGQCAEDGQAVQSCGYREGIGGKFRGFMSRLCPWGHGRNTQVVDSSDGGAFGQGTGGVVAYPYYTTRGPRDFLVDNPPSIGP